MFHPHHFTFGQGPTFGSFALGSTLSAAFILALFLCGSCKDDEPTAPCPVYQVAAFEGTVLAAGIPVVAVVGARAATGPHRGSILIETRSDSTGLYRLSVPAGTYWLEVDPEWDGIEYARSPGLGDTLSVTNQIRHYDLKCGRVIARAAVPRSLDGRTFSAVLLTDPWSIRKSGTVTQGNLEIVFPVVQSAECRLAIETERNFREFWLPGTFDRDAASEFAVPVNQPLTLGLPFENYASISGAVRGSHEEVATAGFADIQAYAVADSSLLAWNVAERDGSFVLDVFPAAPVKVRVEIEDVVQWIGGDSYNTARVYDLHPGDHIGDQTFTESGILCRLEGPGALVVSQSTMTVMDERRRLYRCRYSYDGRPVVHNLRPGRYFVYVSGFCERQTWGSQWYDGARNLTGATPVDIQEGRLASITVHLAPGGTLEGRLLTADGAPVDQEQVTIFDRDKVASCSIQVRESGGFHFEGLGDGGYLLEADTAAGPWWFPGTADQDSARVIEMVDHTSVTGIEWRLP